MLLLLGVYRNARDKRDSDCVREERTVLMSMNCCIFMPVLSFMDAASGRVAPALLGQDPLPPPARAPASTMTSAS